MAYFNAKLYCENDGTIYCSGSVDPPADTSIELYIRIFINTIDSGCIYVGSSSSRIRFDKEIPNYDHVDFDSNNDYELVVLNDDLAELGAYDSCSGSFYASSSGGTDPDPPSDDNYYWGCYDLTNTTDIGTLTSTTSTSISAPNLSGYTYQGYVYHTTYDQCIKYGKKGSYDGTEDTCSKLSSTYPYVIFFYTKDQPKYYWKSYDLTNSTDISSSKTTTNPSISAPSYSNYNYVGLVYHSSYDSCISQGSRRSFDSTASTATASTTYPYVVFFYDRIYYTYITYHYNGGSGRYSDGAQITYSNTSSNRTITLDTPTRTDYTFLGWGSNSSSADIGTTYSVSSTENVSKNVYAIWRRNTIIVTYNANGGSGGPGSYTVNTNSSFNINGSNFPTKSGYIFKGWSTSSSAKIATYKKGATPSISTGTSNITYYAVWWPAFTWKDYSRSEANTFAGYINTYLNSSIAIINDTNPLRLVVWFNAITTALGNNTKVASGDASFKTQLDALLTTYNNY